jgi:hypothetical protein
MNQRPANLDFTKINGIGIIVHTDIRIQMSQEMLVGIRRGATAYMQCIFSPIEAQSFKKNSIYWNVKYMHSQMGFLPEPFSVHNEILFLHYHPSSVPLYKDVGSKWESTSNM